MMYTPLLEYPASSIPHRGETYPNPKHQQFSPSSSRDEEGVHVSARELAEGEVGEGNRGDKDLGRCVLLSGASKLCVPVGLAG